MTDTSSTASQTTPSRRGGGGREGRRALRAAPMASFPTLVREIPVYNIVPDEAVELVHEESLKILEEVGCEFRDDEAIAMWKEAGADVTGTRVRIDRKLLGHVEKHYPTFMEAPDAWAPVALSSLENYARTQQPAPVGPEGAPVAPAPELPAWFRAMMAAQQGAGARPA